MYFRPKSILGIDIDAKLIEAAIKHLEERKEFDSASSSKQVSARSRACCTRIGTDCLSLQDSSVLDKDVNNIEGTEKNAIEYSRRDIVKFRQENCVENDVWDEKFEVIFW